ncbi:hypothetical protein C8035_v008537 [Colletotrichum spinosum]|uniref:Uncharacterized protein n=1 Tax=Colletotrichum spinosum TaxID=1347390 RepID=A0A4R8PQL2_9PEZI|nr:hypothetical protein C8035_v008537 [Colletotrichum spinosum]
MDAVARKGPAFENLPVEILLQIAGYLAGATWDGYGPRLYRSTLEFAGDSFRSTESCTGNVLNLRVNRRLTDVCHKVLLRHPVYCSTAWKSFAGLLAIDHAGRPRLTVPIGHLLIDESYTGDLKRTLEGPLGKKPYEAACFSALRSVEVCNYVFGPCRMPPYDVESRQTWFKFLGSIPSLERLALDNMHLDGAIAFPVLPNVKVVMFDNCRSVDKTILRNFPSVREVFNMVSGDNLEIPSTVEKLTWEPHGGQVDLLKLAIRRLPSLKHLEFPLPSALFGTSHAEDHQNLTGSLETLRFSSYEPLGFVGGHYSNHVDQLLSAVNALEYKCRHVYPKLKSIDVCAMTPIHTYGPSSPGRLEQACDLMEDAQRRFREELGVELIHRCTREYLLRAGYL